MENHVAEKVVVGASSAFAPAPEGDSAAANTGAGGPEVLSKKKQKKLEKYGGEEGIKAYWAKKKQEKKIRKKESNALKREDQKVEWNQLSEEEKDRKKKHAQIMHDQRRKEEEENQLQTKLNVESKVLPYIIFDMNFCEGMDMRDRKSTVSQLKFSYSIMRKATFNLRPIFTSYNPAMEPFGELESYNGFKSNPPQFEQKHWSEVVDPSKIVYLTADTETVLTSLEPETYYVIGAFVDHNTRKGATLESSKQHQVRTARLPLDEHLDIKNLCKVLTINHVTEILCRFAATGDWKHAFAVLPTRRQTDDEKEVKKE